MFVYMHTNDNDLITLIPYVFVDVTLFTQRVNCINCTCAYIHSNENDFNTLIPRVYAGFRGRVG